MGARILTGAVVGEQSIVAAGAVVREGMKIPPRSLVVGVPAIVKKQLSEEEIALIKSYCSNYLGYSRTYREKAEQLNRALTSLH
jgi:carbonic anhydrase/acetyltransferase-like protein (isoleucine patch superfamily)